MSAAESTVPAQAAPKRRGFDRLPKTIASIRDFTASQAILLFLIGGLLYLGHAAFVPIALALLGALILSGPVEALHRVGVPRSLSATLILVLSAALLAGALTVLWGPLQGWYAAAPKTLSIIQAKVTPVAKLLGHLAELSSRATSVGAAPAPAAPVAGLTSMPAEVMEAVRDALVGLATFMIVTLFLLAGGPPMVARMTAAFFDHLKANHVLNYIEKVRHEVGHYYLVTSCINVGLGLATTAVMAAWGMPTPYLWGAVAAGLNYFPYVGSATTLLIVSVVALVSFNGTGHALGVAVSYLALATLEGQVVQPWLVGRRLEVNPLLIFLGLWLGGFFWGVAGVILATPTLVALKVIAERSPHGESMLQFLGPNTANAAPAKPKKGAVRKTA